MINLAGQQDCDETVIAELEAADINIAAPIYGRTSDGYITEVPTHIVGWLGGEPVPADQWEVCAENKLLSPRAMREMFSFVFVRDWYYWRVDGLVPLGIADRLHKLNKVEVRPGGDCACRPPETWALRHPVCGQRVVDHYHIDSQEGLNLFARVLRQENLV